ncbi:hypothetical protein L345_18547, partial [Ophiophagus hannah]
EGRGGGGGGGRKGKL